MTTPSSRVHDCRAFCRPPRHADVVYTAWAWDEPGAAGPNGFVALDVYDAMRRRWRGVRVLDARPAPEALPVEEARRLPGYGYLRRGGSEPSHAWLVVWEEDEG